MRLLEGIGARQVAHDPALRGYHCVYRQNEINHCPACGRSHWFLGRVSAECGFCAAALPFATAAFATAQSIVAQ
jgi:hypothetical protein